jgi:predicted DNA-binding protein (MmcQ/YjbR family)
MTLEGLREICRALPGATEDVKWEQDLCFSVGGKMFAAVNLEPPHQLGFKCTPETFAELTEREGIIPAPYLARAMWVQESELGTALERRELTLLLRSAYDLVVAKLPKSKRPGPAPWQTAQKRAGTTKGRASKRRGASGRR